MTLNLGLHLSHLA